MKPITACFALVFLTSALSATAQTTPAPSTAASRPVLSAAEIAKMLNGVHSGHGDFDITPQEKARVDARMAQFNELNHAATEALHLKKFTDAEADFRGLIQIDSGIPGNYYGLGEALAGQGKTAEAIVVYKTAVYWPLNTNPQAIAIMQARGNTSNLRGCCSNTDALAWMKYALLLSQTGQNAEAFSVYSQALRCVSDVNGSGITLFSAADAPSPSAFQAAVHIALGLLDDEVLTDHKQAMSEFEAALRLTPDAAVTNYYYGYGWQRLDLQSPTKAATALQAKAALAKAVASNNDTVKKAAAEAMKRMP